MDPSIVLREKPDICTYKYVVCTYKRMKIKDINVNIFHPSILLHKHCGFHAHLDVEAAGAGPDGNLVRMPLVLPVGRGGGGGGGVSVVAPPGGGRQPAGGRGDLVLLLLVVVLVVVVLLAAQAGAQAPAQAVHPARGPVLKILYTEEE